MSALHFDKSTGRLFLIDAKTQPIAGPWAAANFVDSQAKGVFPVGTFKFEAWQNHPGDGPDSPFGSSGVATFLVAGRDGMGVHSGRENAPDALGRRGIAHCTFGCIRTTNDAMKAIAAEHAEDPITEIFVT
jgi:hypothetical protein